MEAEQKTAEEAVQVSLPVKQEAAQVAPLAKIDVTTWFSVKLKEHKKLRPAHYAAVLAFFKNKNLSENETKETFDKMLKAFGF